MPMRGGALVQQRCYRRVEIRGKVLTLKKLLEKAIHLLDIEEVTTALLRYAPPSARAINDITGVQWMIGVTSRLEKVVKSIRSGPGRDLLRNSMGIPGAELMCAACTIELVKAVTCAFR